MKTITIIYILTILGLVANGQSLYKSWYSQKSNLCIIIDSSSTQINELKNLKIIRKDNELLIKFYYWTNGLTFWRQSEKYRFHIEKLTNDSLVLSQKFQENLFEVMSDSITRFSVSPSGCMDKWKIIRK